MANDSFLGTEELPLIVPSQDEKTLAVLTHVLTFIFPIVGPLVIYLVKKNESDFVSYHAKESLNFQITMFLVCILLAITIVGILLVWIVGLFTCALAIVAAIRASEGKLYKYPINFRLIK